MPQKRPRQKIARPAAEPPDTSCLEVWEEKDRQVLGYVPKPRTPWDIAYARHKGRQRRSRRE